MRVSCDDSRIDLDRAAFGEWSAPVKTQLASLLSLRDEFGPGGTIAGLPSDVFHDFACLVESRSGISRGFAYKLAPHISDKLSQYALKSPQEYLEYLKRNENSIGLQGLLEACCTHETKFFRDRDQFSRLKQILDSENKSHVRMWSAACATGEEAYSICLTALASKPRAKRQFEFHATDLSEKAIETAKRGAYPASSLSMISGEFQKKFVETPIPKDYAPGNFEFRNEFKSSINFEQLNLIEAQWPKFTKGLDVVFARNVFIYFDTDVQRTLATRLVDSLNIGGYLFTDPDIAGEISQWDPRVQNENGGILHRC